jgi:MscS family membrane protein
VVTEIGIRSTRLKTLAGRIVTIPNATFTGSAVENISAEPWRKVSMTLGLTYDTPAEGMERGMEILRRIAAEDEDLEEEPLVAFSEFGDWSMNLLFIYYIKKGADILGAQTRVNLAILRELGAAGLEFAFPTQTLYTIRQPEGDADQAQQV